MSSQASSSLGEKVSVPMVGPFYATPTWSECEADEPAYHGVPSLPPETIQSSAWCHVIPAVVGPIPTASTADARKGNNNKLGQQQREFNKKIETAVIQLRDEMATKASVEQVPTLHSLQQVQSEVDDKAAVQDIQQLQTKVTQLQSELATKANVEQVPTLLSLQQVQSEVEDKAAVQDVKQLQASVTQLQTELATRMQKVQSEVDDKAAVQDIQQLQTRVMWCMICLMIMLVAFVMLGVMLGWLCTVMSQLQTEVAQLQTELKTKANVETVPTLHSMQRVQSEVDDKAAVQDVQQLQTKAAQIQKELAMQANVEQKVEQANQEPSKVGNNGYSLPMPNPRDKYGHSALCLAAEQDSPDLIELLLDNLDAKEINSGCGFDCETALIYAIDANRTEVATAMINHSKVDINLLCRGRSVMYYVMESANVEIAQQLLLQRRFTKIVTLPYFVQGEGPHEMAYMGEASLYPSRRTIANLIITGDEVSDAVSKRM